MNRGSVQKVLVIHSFSFCLYTHSKNEERTLEKKSFLDLDKTDFCHLSNIIKGYCRLSEIFIIIF